MAKDAFDQGKLAYEHNHPMSACDYPVGSSLRAEWMAGWTGASNVRPNASRAEQATPEADPGNRDRTAHRL